MLNLQVRFTEQFFDRLDELLPSERGPDGEPSITDFLLFDLPSVSDRLRSNYFENTLETGEPEVRVYIGGNVGCAIRDLRGVGRRGRRGVLVEP